MELSDSIADSRLIITAASRAYGKSLLALLGSLTLNWPHHPPVLVYDIGLDETTLSMLLEHNIAVRAVPPFCPHWRKHFTWKIWCWNDALARDVLWLDAGVLVLQPMDEVFDAIDRLGYFAIPTYHLLSENASEAACRGCGVHPEFRSDKMTLAGGIVGFRKVDLVLDIIRNALSVALTEEHIAATEPLHRHDQAILSLLMHKSLGNVVMLDGLVYGGWLSPQQTPGQKIWAYRGKASESDLARFAAHLSIPGAPYVPAPIATGKRTLLSGFRRLLHLACRALSSDPRYVLRRAPTILRSVLFKSSQDARIYDGVHGSERDD